MFPYEIWNNPVWCLYDDMNGNIKLKHPRKRESSVLCPHCGKVLLFSNYKAICCDKNFDLGINVVSQKEPIGKHNNKTGRGWSSIRPYIK